MLRRFISDLRDLWTLITKGQPESDPLLPWRMMAEMAKFQQPIDIDDWEREQFARNRLAVWFDPERYAGTEFDWPKPVEPHRLGGIMQNPYANTIGQLAYAQQCQLQNSLHYGNHMNNALGLGSILGGLGAKRGLF